MYYELINHATKSYPFLIEHTNVKYIPHFHDEIEIIFVLEGRLSITIENNSFVLESGEICIVTSGLIHNLYSYEPSKTFVMKAFPVVDLVNIQLHDAIIVPNAKCYKKLKRYILDIMAEHQTKAPGYELSVNIGVQKIFLTILRDMEYSLLGDHARIKQTNKSEFLNSVMAFLEQYYAEDFGLEDVANHLNYTKSYFCHHFKRITGVTFWSYYTIFRLEKSIQLMKKHPQKRYLEISERSGFKNVRSFNQAFKQYHYCTPREYMKKYYALGEEE
ncbi:MAG: AraC family transcriptional regulator [Ruminococcaceae bacterium]|nr:AraC family transcriptional regulator [Oscillospiraceae bacterium]